MSDPRSIPAKYDANRQPNGHFAKGNSLAAGAGLDQSKRFRELRAIWWSMNSTDEVAKVKEELLKLCETCPNPDVRLKAIVYYLDRTLGKPQEQINVDVSADASPIALPDLSPDEVMVLAKVVRRQHEKALPEPEIIPAGFELLD